MTEQTFAVGDLVTTNTDFYPGSTAGVVYRITKAPTRANEKNYKAERVNPDTNEAIPGAQGLRGPAYALLPYDPDATPGAVEIALPPRTGAVIRVNPDMVRQADGDALYVVLGESRKGGVKAALLGGDPSGRYFPHLPTSTVTEVPLAEVATYLAGK